MLFAAICLGASLHAQVVYTWNSGDILTGSITPTGTTTVNPADTLNIVSALDHDFNALAVTNNGTVNWQDGNLRSGSSGSITNTGIWNDNTTVNRQVNNAFGGGAATFTNYGTYNKTAATSDTQF